MDVNINKNISVWRGDTTPPTEYHFWIKPDGTLLVLIDDLWVEKYATKTNLDNTTIVQVDPSNDTILTAYELHDAKGNKKGVTINIPKDLYIKDVKISTLDATLDEDGMIIDGTGTTALCISYILANGSYKLVSIDYLKFLEETEFGDGTEVVEHKVKIKIDPTSDSYLTVGPDGLKLSGVTEELKGYLPLTGGTVTGNLTVNGTLYATTVTSTARHIDINRNVVINGNTTIDGKLTVDEIVASDVSTSTINPSGSSTVNINNGTMTVLYTDSVNTDGIYINGKIRSANGGLNTPMFSIEDTGMYWRNEDNVQYDKTYVPTAWGGFIQPALKTDLEDYVSKDGDTITGNLTAPIFIGDLQGTATKATQDASGNVITTTYATKEELAGYLPLTGGTMTGNITFESAPGSNGHEYVDLGLPSGNLWAKCNIGANTEEEGGLYFQWGDTQGYTAEQVGDGEGLKAFRLADYKFSIDGSSSNFSKYNKSDGKVVLDPEDDAAHVNMGGNWRMPTLEEYKELCFNTDIYLVPTEGEEIQGSAKAQSGSVSISWASQAEGALKGVKFYKKGDKQTYMFVPAYGFVSGGSMRNDGYGYLWTSSLVSSGVLYAFYFCFTQSVGIVNVKARHNGVPVRGILSSNTENSKGIIIEGKTESDLLNAAGGTTSINDIATQVQAAIVDSAPETLDTLNELAAALGDDPNFAATITTQIGQKANAIHTHNVADISGLSDVATSGDYNDLSNTPTIPTYSAVTTTENGLMTSTDKSRLDTIHQQLTTLDGVSHIADGQAFTQSEGNLIFNFSCIKPTDAENNKVIHSVAIPTATTEAAGVMTAEDKNKLNTVLQQLTVKSTITWVELD